MGDVLLFDDFVVLNLEKVTSFAIDSSTATFAPAGSLLPATSVVIVRQLDLDSPVIVAATIAGCINRRLIANTGIRARARSISLIDSISSSVYNERYAWMALTMTC